MKNSFLSVVVAAALMLIPAYAKAKTANVNTEIIPGQVWNDTDGNPINAHGGGILYHEGTYYWYGEYKKGKTILPEWATWECYRTDVTGVSCYSSKDLMNWKFEGIVLPAVKDDPEHDLHPSKVLERPKVIFNQKTRKFVMWAHVESADYSKACAGVAVSDSPTGPFTYLGSFRPNEAMSRDQTVFVDDDGRAYQFYSSENNATLYISELTDDYLKPSGRYTRNFIGMSREAPAVFKHNGKYYLLSSGCTGWDPNQAELAVADSIMGEWKVIGNPCTGKDADKTFYGQSTYVQQVMGKKDTYIAMFDKWNKTDLENSLYIWLPISFENGKITIPWRDKWNFDLFEDQPRFEAGNGTFLLNGEPFIVKAAELHYPRIPRPYWDQRIKLCKALGMNTVCLYVFWNAHEPEKDKFDFTGQNDLAEFCRLCQANDMYVILRPGPYVCAEWEMGGLPWWLLKKKDIRLREDDPYFLERVAIFEKEVAKQVSDLTIGNGGPILMIQVENEYGSYGESKKYVAAIRDMLKANYDDVTLFQCDWESNFHLNGLPDLIWTMNFGTGANIDQQFAKLKKVRPTSPLMCSEFWSGWFDKWGANHETRPAADMVAGIDEMLSKGISFSLYMTHGGTNWGHWAGANSPGFAPDVTSYDYDAPISESGQTTPKYWELRKTLAKYMNGEKQAKVPALIKPISINEFQFTEFAPLFANLPEAKHDKEIRTMEEYDQGFGSILYRTTLPEMKTQSTLTVNEAHDYAQIFIDGKYIGKLDRRNGEKQLTLPPCAKGAQLDILVEAMGRINFGRAIKDFKGITENVEISYNVDGYTFTCDLQNWDVFNIFDEYDFYTAMKFEPLKETKAGEGERLQPGCYRATFNVKKPSDTFLNFETWGKGLVYVNGHGLGRIWEIGPQQTLYVPGCWLNKGENEILVFDIVGPREAKSEGLKQPLLDQLLVKKPLTHRNEGENLDLSAESPVYSGSFAPGNGWQEVKFDAPVAGRYVCIEALNAQDGKDIACIAEMYLLDENNERLSREPWIVKYADSEDVAHVNRSADKTFDLQESTYWSTVEGTPYPHSIVIDLGSSRTLTGFQYLPRMESNAPGSIKDFKIYVKPDNFKY